jgi:hypothetical protein
MKHIDVLREAGLIHTREERRQRINSLNVVPIRQIYERWVGRFEELWASHLLRIKEDSEAIAAEAHMAQLEKEPAARSGTRSGPKVASPAPPALRQTKKRPKKG